MKEKETWHLGASCGSDWEAERSTALSPLLNYCLSSVDPFLLLSLSLSRINHRSSIWVLGFFPLLLLLLLLCCFC
jgi:hypothetical protein